MLKLKDVSAFSQDGVYQCIVTEGIQVVGIGVAKLEVVNPLPIALPLVVGQADQRRPYLIYASPDQKTQPGGSAKLKCIAGGNPMPHLSWVLNGKVLVSQRFMTESIFNINLPF